MKTNKLTKKEINNNLKVGKQSRSIYKYSATIRGFTFESVNEEIRERDDQGYLTYVCPAHTKKQITNDLFEWFKKYASQVFDE
jgi:hypothetical protein